MPFFFFPLMANRAAVDGDTYKSYFFNVADFRRGAFDNIISQSCYATDPIYSIVISLLLENLKSRPRNHRYNA